MSAAIVALINAKGGSGATTIALEVARAITARRQAGCDRRRRTCPERNVAVLLDAVRAFDAERSTSTYSLIDARGCRPSS